MIHSLHLRRLACLAVFAILPGLGSCTLENERPDLPLATAPGFEVLQIPREPRKPDRWDRTANSIYGEATYQPPAEGSLKGNSAHPFFRSSDPDDGR